MFITLFSSGIGVKHKSGEFLKTFCVFYAGGQITSKNIIYIYISYVTVCPRSSDPFYIVPKFIKWERLLGHTEYVIYKTSWPSAWHVFKGGSNTILQDYLSIMRV